MDGYRKFMKIRARIHEDVSSSDAYDESDDEDDISDTETRHDDTLMMSHAER